MLLTLIYSVPFIYNWIMGFDPVAEASLSTLILGLDVTVIGLALLGVVIFKCDWLAMLVLVLGLAAVALAFWVNVDSSNSLWASWWRPLLLAVFCLGPLVLLRFERRRR
ncbi:MAG: SPW repeat protein [Propionibacteriaceae bacterium]|nr:SPW repeat protein [Propionibacteriaceae bacterium]